MSCGCNENSFNNCVEVSYGTCLVPCPSLTCDHLDKSLCVVNRNFSYFVPYTDTLVPNGDLYLGSAHGSIESYIQHLILYVNSSTKNCTLNGQTSRIVPFFYTQPATYNGINYIKLCFEPVPSSYLASGWSVTSYVIEIYDVTSSTLYTINVPVSSVGQNLYCTLISHISGMSVFGSGNKFRTSIVTNTSDGVGSASCRTVRQEITFV